MSKVKIISGDKLFNSQTTYFLQKMSIQSEILLCPIVDKKNTHYILVERDRQIQTWQTVWLCTVRRNQQLRLFALKKI